MCVLPTKDAFFRFSEVRDAFECERVLCRQCSLLEQLFVFRESMLPGKLCTVCHELFVGQTRERVGKFGVDVFEGEGMVNADVRGTPSRLLFLVAGGADVTFLFVGTFGRHGRGGESAKTRQVGGLLAAWLFIRWETVLALSFASPDYRPGRLMEWS